MAAAHAIAFVAAVAAAFTIARAAAFATAFAAALAAAFALAFAVALADDVAAVVTVEVEQRLQNFAVAFARVSTEHAQELMSSHFRHVLEQGFVHVSQTACV